jgi:hypothetical protein
MFEYWQNARASQSGGARRKSKVGKTKRLANGAVGVWKRVGGKTVFRIKSSTKKAVRKASKSRGRRRVISPRSAKIAMTKYYNKKSYKTSRGRAIAIGRDMCGANKPVRRTTAYKRSPFKYDFRGLDDGSRCARKGSATKKRRISASQKRVLRSRLSKARKAKARKSRGRR